ncbi:MAG: hypothetical protein ABSD56_09480, partial [Bryobacteraceae bacterium]
MLLVLALDAAGYILAVGAIPHRNSFGDLEDDRKRNDLAFVRLFLGCPVDVARVAGDDPIVFRRRLEDGPGVVPVSLPTELDHGCPGGGQHR